MGDLNFFKFFLSSNVLHNCPRLNKTATTTTKQTNSCWDLRSWRFLKVWVESKLQGKMAFNYCPDSNLSGCRPRFWYCLTKVLQVLYEFNAIAQTRTFQWSEWFQVKFYLISTKQRWKSETDACCGFLSPGSSSWAVLECRQKRHSSAHSVTYLRQIYKQTWYVCFMFAKWLVL